MCELLKQFLFQDFAFACNKRRPNPKYSRITLELIRENLGLNPHSDDNATVTTLAKSDIIPTVPVKPTPKASNTVTACTVVPPKVTTDIKNLKHGAFIDLADEDLKHIDDPDTDLQNEDQPEIDIDALKNIISKGSFFIPFPDAADNIQKILDNHIFKDKLAVTTTTTCVPGTYEATTVDKPCDVDHSLDQSCQKCNHGGIDKLLIYLQKKQPSCN